MKTQQGSTHGSGGGGEGCQNAVQEHHIETVAGPCAMCGLGKCWTQGLGISWIARTQPLEAENAFSDSL